MFIIIPTNAQVRSIKLILKLLKHVNINFILLTCALVHIIIKNIN